MPVLKLSTTITLWHLYAEQRVKRNNERFPEELKKEIIQLDAKLNQVFKFLLDKLDSMHQKAKEPRIPIGYKIDKNK